MKQNLHFKIEIVSAALADYPVVQNMARFYVYDLSKSCGFISKEWACPKNGLFESFDIKSYFIDGDKKAFILKVDEELAGFVLLHQVGTVKDPQWDMAEFFIMGKFQGKGIGEKVARKIWHEHLGRWEVSVIPENKPALAFWRKVVSSLTSNKFVEEIRDINYDKYQPQRYFLSFLVKK